MTNFMTDYHGNILGKILGSVENIGKGYNVLTYTIDGSFARWFEMLNKVYS